MMRFLARSHPFLWLLAATLLVIGISYAANPQYDDGGLGLLWFLVALVVLLPYRLLATVVGGVVGEAASSFVVPVLFIIIMLILDVVTTRYARRRMATR